MTITRQRTLLGTVRAVAQIRLKHVHCTFFPTPNSEVLEEQRGRGREKERVKTLYVTNFCNHFFVNKPQ